MSGLTDQFRDGTAAEYVAVEARNLAPKPHTADHVHAAAVPRAGLTAWQALFDHGRLARGQTVVIHGAGAAFYAAASGARVLHQTGQGDDIVAQLAVGEAAFWVAAAGPEGGRFGPRAMGGATGRILLVADDPDAVVQRAIDAGATGNSRVCDEHGWRLGRIVDPFGHKWEIGKPIGHWPPA